MATRLRVMHRDRVLARHVGWVQHHGLPNRREHSRRVLGVGRVHCGVAPRSCSCCCARGRGAAIAGRRPAGARRRRRLGVCCRCARWACCAQRLPPAVGGAAPCWCGHAGAAAGARTKGGCCTHGAAAAAGRGVGVAGCCWVGRVRSKGVMDVRINKRLLWAQDRPPAGQQRSAGRGKQNGQPSAACVRLSSRSKPKHTSSTLAVPP